MVSSKFYEFGIFFQFFYIYVIEVEEEELVFKSDHEFSPESDIEEQEAAPARRARTLQKGFFQAF